MLIYKYRLGVMEKNQLKILFASATDSGILRVRSELIKTLLEQGHSVIVAAPLVKDYKKLEEMGCTMVPVTIDHHGTNPFSDLKLYKQYKKLLGSVKPDVVLLFTTKPNIYCGIACKKLGIPAVMNITGMGSALGNKGLLQKVMVKLYKCSCNGQNLKRVFFQNDASKEFFEKHKIGDSSLFVRIPGSGVNLDTYPLLPFPEGSTVDFLFVARIMKQKGIDNYIEAAKMIRKDHPEARFHVLGDAKEPYKSKLDEAASSGDIVYHGRVDNIPDFQRMSQCTVQPSYYPEGMSNVILEAAASGRPVITTDHPGCREGVDDGITGFIVPVNDTDALVKAIERFLALSTTEREEMGRRGRMKMEKEFSRIYVTSAYMDILMDISDNGKD